MSKPSSFSGYFSSYNGLLLVSELPPKPDLRGHHSLSLGSSFHIADIIVSFASVMLLSFVTTSVILSKVTSSKPMQVLRQRAYMNPVTSDGKGIIPACLAQEPPVKIWLQL